VGEQTALEELKAKIYEHYSKVKDGPSSDRRQVDLVRLWELAVNWCGYFEETKQIFIEEKIIKDEIGVEVFDAVHRCVEKAKMQKKDFIPYLYRALVNACNQYYRNRIEEGSLKKARVIKEIKKLIRMEESNEGRELTRDEKVYLICEWKQTSEKTARAYVDSMDRTLVSITCNDDGEKTDAVDLVPGGYLTSEDDAINDMEKEIIREALETVLNKGQKRTYPFRKALSTIRCLELFRDYQALLPVLDGEVLEKTKTNGKIPTQYEIYMLHHPDADKEGAEANASKTKKKLFADIDREIRKKDPEILKKTKFSRKPAL